MSARLAIEGFRLILAVSCSCCHHARIDIELHPWPYIPGFYFLMASSSRGGPDWIYAIQFSTPSSMDSHLTT